MIEDLTREFTDLRSDILSRLNQLETKFSHLPEVEVHWLENESPLPEIKVNSSIQVKIILYC